MNEHKPLTQNLGAALMAAGVTTADGHIPAHMGIDLVVPKDPVEGFNAESEEAYSVENNRRGARRRRHVDSSTSRNIMNQLGAAAAAHDVKTQNTRANGHKNSGGTHTSQNNDTKENNNMETTNSTNGTVSHDTATNEPSKAHELAPEVAALRGIAGLESLALAVEKLGSQGVKYLVAQEELNALRNDKSSAVLVGAGVGGLVGAIGGGAAVMFVPEVPGTTQDVVAGATLFGIIGMFTGAGGNLAWANWRGRRNAKKQ